MSKRNLQEMIDNLKEREHHTLDAKRDRINIRYLAMQRQLEKIASFTGKETADILSYIGLAITHYENMPLDTAIDLVLSFYIWMHNDEEKQQ